MDRKCKTLKKSGLHKKIECSRKGTFGGGIWKPVRKKRPGVHSKTKHSNSKGSKNYVKKYRGQGR